METEEKFIHLQNIVKGIFTSIIGLVAMSAAGYGWWTDHLTDWQAGGLAIIGFALLFMTDKIPTFIDQFVQAVLKKLG